MIELFSFSTKDNGVLVESAASKEATFIARLGSRGFTSMSNGETFDRGYPIPLEIEIIQDDFYPEILDGDNKSRKFTVMAEHLGLVPLQLGNVFYDYICTVYSSIDDVTRIINEHEGFNSVLKQFGYGAKQ